MTFKTEIDPTPEQIIKINKTFGVCRFVYNFFIAHNKELYEKDKTFINGNDFIKWLNHDFIPSNSEYLWIKDVYSRAIKKSIQNADYAFMQFFKGKCNYPRFKRKHDSNVTMYFYKNNPTDCLCERHRIKIPSLGWVRLKEKGYIPTTKSGIAVKSGAVSKKAGRYYVSVLVEMPDSESYEPLTEGIGVHLGIRELAVVSNGTSYCNINKSARMRKLEKKLKRERRKLSRKQLMNKDSDNSKGKNIEKQLLRVQQIYQRMANIRNDHMNKVICEIVKTKPSYITVRDMCVRDMNKSRIFSKAVTEQGLYTFSDKLKAKCLREGIELRLADRLFPAAKRCHCCGAVADYLSTRDSVFKCRCGYCSDRALNASLNLRDTAVYTVA